MSGAERRADMVVPDRFGPDGRWRPTGVVGSGGHATVYAAIDTRFELPVAVKVLADNHAGNLDLRERFLQEAALLRRLPGPLVPVYDLGETASGQPFIVMPLADGGDLQRRIEDWRHSNRPTVDDLVTLASVLTRTISPLHALGVVHRDLKPSNLLLFGPVGPASASAVRVGPGTPLIGSTETVLLADLGLAKDLAGGSGLTVGGGTLGFRPPEQEQAGQVTERADIWAASALLYWFVVGRSAAGDPALDRNGLVEATVPEELAAVIVGGMAPDPEARPESITAWHRDLRAALVSVGPGGLHPTARVPTVRAAAGGGTTGADRGRPMSGAARRAPTAVAVWMALALGMVAGAVGARVLFGGVDDSMASAVSTEGETVRATSSGEGLTVTVTGPAEVAVGDLIELVATVDGDVADLVWIDPGGTMHPGETADAAGDGVRFALSATSAGRASVRLLATTTSGETIRVEVPVVVVE